MGNTDTKLNFRKAVVQLTTKTQPVEAGDEAFWSQFWSESVSCVQDVFTLIPAAEIRALREENPSNLATLCYKNVEKLVQAGEAGCRTQREQQTVLNCIRLLTRILPYIFEDPDWRGFFWSTLPGQAADESGETESAPLAQSLINAMCDLMFCPEFTVASNKKSGPDNPEDMTTIDSCEYIWQAGVGFAHTPPSSAQYDQNRAEILKLLLTCFSESMYLPPVADAHNQPNQWIAYFTSTENRHALPLFTSLLNTVCAYDPVGYGVPYNHLMFSDHGEPLVESALQVLTVTLDNEPGSGNTSVDGTTGNNTAMDHVSEVGEVGGPDNLFINYLSRIHREEDFAFILKGLTRLLNNPLMQTYLPGSCKRIQFHQELLVLFWKMCDINKKFMFYVLKSSDVLDILVPILYFLNDARADQSRVGLMHIGVFILLLLSGERNFGVRLNKPYTVRVPMDIPVFTGTHADFLIIVFHKIITTGHQRLQPLFDCLLTIIVNVSPYLKTLSMVASTKMLHLLEAFSTPWFLYASPTNHHLVFFLLEVFNNIIQYQFDGNSNLVYTIIRKRNVFHQLANLATDHTSIAKALTKRGKKFTNQPHEVPDGPSMEGSTPAMEAEPGTLKATLAATPAMPSPTVCYDALAQLSVSRDRDLNNLNAKDLMFCGAEDVLVNDWPPQDSGQMGGGLLQVVQHQSKTSQTFQYIPHWSSDLAINQLSENEKDYAEINHKGGLASFDNFSNSIPRRKMPPRSESLPAYNEIQFILEERNRWFSTNTVLPKKQSLKTILETSQDPIESESLSEVKNRLAQSLGIENMTEKSPASVAHIEQPMIELASAAGTLNVQPGAGPGGIQPGVGPANTQPAAGPMTTMNAETPVDSGPGGQVGQPADTQDGDRPRLIRAQTLPTPPVSPTLSQAGAADGASSRPPLRKGASISSTGGWVPSPEWVQSWKLKLPLQTIMRLLQVLVPQVEKICIDKGLTDESEILKFLQHGTLVGLLPVPHPILIRKYQANSGTTMWFRTYMWGVIYLRNVDPPVWYDTDVKLFEIQRV